MKLTDQTPELPTTEHVRFIYSLDGADYVEPDYREYKAQEFDRWLAARDERIRAAAEQRGAIKALRAAASDYALYADSHDLDGEPVDYLNDRADRLEGDVD